MEVETSMITLSAGMYSGELSCSCFINIFCSGGTAGCVVAGRLAEDPNVSILLVEAGSTNDEVPASAIPAG